MNHEHFQELISLHIDNELADTQSAELFAHLATCGTCRTFLRTTTGIRSQIVHENLADVPERLDRRVLGMEQGPSVKKPLDWIAPIWWTRISLPLPAAASLAFLILFCTLLISPLFMSPKNPQTASVDNLKSVPAEIRTQVEMYR